MQHLYALSQRAKAAGTHHLLLGVMGATPNCIK